MMFRRVGIIAGATLALAAGAASMHEARAAEAVTVHRGGRAIKTETVAGGVELVRGPAVLTPVYKEPKAGPVQIMAGDELWLLDPGAERLTACALRSTSKVGREAIRCTSRSLPRTIPAEALRRAD